MQGDRANTPVAPTTSGQIEAVVDESGRSILGMLQKAGDMVKEDSARALDVAHKVSLQLRAVEERTREAEAEVAHFRERAQRAEAWLERIYGEVEQTFFQKKDRGEPPTDR
jgi:hypothetical protein